MHSCTHAHSHVCFSTYIPVINGVVAEEDVTAGWSDTGGAVVRNLLCACCENALTSGDMYAAGGGKRTNKAAVADKDAGLVPSAAAVPNELKGVLLIAVAVVKAANGPPAVVDMNGHMGSSGVQAGMGIGAINAGVSSSDPESDSSVPSR